VTKGKVEVLSPAPRKGESTATPAKK